MTLSHLIDEFLDSYWPRYENLIAAKKTNAKALLKDKKKNSRRDDSYFLQDQGISANEEINANGLESLTASIKDSIKRSSNKKGTIEVYKIFCEYLEKKSILVKIDWPTVDISNRLECILFIAKYLQDGKPKSELENILMLGEKTINEYVKTLEEGTEFLGTPFRVDTTRRHRNRIDFPSTVHPILLTPNLTQVLIMLKELKAVYVRKKIFQEYAWHLAVNIWQQLSDYARDRILYVLENLMPEDIDWYKELDEAEREGHFQTEEYLSRRGSDSILDCLKNRKKCHIEYKNEDGSVVFLQDCTVIKLSGDSIVVEHAEGASELMESRILRSAYTKEELV